MHLIVVPRPLLVVLVLMLLMAVAGAVAYGRARSSSQRLFALALLLNGALIFLMLAGAIWLGGLGHHH